MAERIIYDRDGAGKLTSEAKYELERLNKEVVCREYKESRRDKDEFEEKYVNMDPEYVFKRKPVQRLKWLEKAFEALLNSRIKPNGVYDIISHNRFVDGVNDSMGRPMYQLVDKNAGFFTERQQRFLASNRFILFKKYSVMTILDSDEEDAAFQAKKRPLKDSEKTEAQKAKEAIERAERERLADALEEKQDEKKRRRLEEEKAAKEARSESESRSRSHSPPAQSSSDAESDDELKKKKNEANHISRIRPDGKPRVERRIDPADGAMYSLEEFIAEYGGSDINPPLQWMQNIHTAFFYNE